MALKYHKIKHIEEHYKFTGADFARACYEAEIGPCKMEAITGGKIYHKKFNDWRNAGDKYIEVDEQTMKLILSVLGAK